MSYSVAGCVSLEFKFMDFEFYKYNNLQNERRFHDFFVYIVLLEQRVLGLSNVCCYIIN